MNLKSLYLCPLVALLIFSLLPSMGAGEGTFSLVSAETNPGGVPLPLNHTVEVGYSTLYRARAINGLNRSVTASFVAAGLPEGATAVITPSQATLGEVVIIHPGEVLWARYMGKRMLVCAINVVGEGGGNWWVLLVIGVVAIVGSCVCGYKEEKVGGGGYKGRGGEERRWELI